MQLFQKSLFFLAVMVALTGCGSTPTSTSTSSSSGDSLVSSGGSGDLSSLSSLSGSSDPSTLMGGGGLDMSMLLGGTGDDSSSDDSSSSDDDSSSSSSSTNTVSTTPYQDNGDVFIMYNGQKLYFKAISVSDDDSIIVSSYQENLDKSYTITIAGYDTSGNVIHTENGYLVFTFEMPDLTTTGVYDLKTPEHTTGSIFVNGLEMLSNGYLHIKGQLQNAEIYSQDMTTRYRIDVDFDVDLHQLEPEIYTK